VPPTPVPPTPPTPPAPTPPPVPPVPPIPPTPPPTPPTPPNPPAPPAPDYSVNPYMVDTKTLTKNKFSASGQLTFNNTAWNSGMNLIAQEKFGNDIIGAEKLNFTIDP